MLNSQISQKYSNSALTRKYEYPQTAKIEKKRYKNTLFRKKMQKPRTDDDEVNAKKLGPKL